MQKKFYSAVFLLLFLNLLIKPVWIFAIDRQVQNTVGQIEYGNFFALLNLSIIVNFLLDPGLTSYYNRHISRDPAQLKNDFPAIAQMKLALGLLYAVCLVALGVLTRVATWQLLLLLGINQFLFSFFIYVRSSINALQLFKTDAWLSILDKLMMILACGLILYYPNIFGKITVMRFAGFQAITVGVSLLAALAILLTHVKINFKWSIPDVRVLRAALPFGIIVLLMSAHSRQAAFILERLHYNGAYETGIYASGFRLLDAANMIGYLLATFLLPFIAKHHNDTALVKKTVLNARNFLLSTSIVIIAFICWQADWLYKILYHTNDDHAAILPLTIASLIGYSLVQVYGTYLTATGSIILFIKVTLPFFILNYLLNLFFIESYGAEGSAIISIVTQTLYGIAVMYVATNKMEVINDPMAKFKIKTAA